MAAHSRTTEVLDKLTSRKFWVTTTFLVAATVGQQLGLDIDAATLEFVTYGVIAYLLGQGATDAAGAFRNRRA